ncbi:expressed unknown protein [Seminavis robusta]|uniref:Uncharacterized protein n=1 Tax=Seminavis robusta TaxID=568900 RepID=A0A9N8EBZ5_9STRA|nr:expressed unknown protein [Seminavis robusta]|eukprot:Sro781_g201620.1 n/a (275) ;mRNA; r:33086-33910
MREHWESFLGSMAPTTPAKPITSKFNDVNYSPPAGHEGVVALDVENRAANLGIKMSDLSKEQQAKLSYMLMKNFDRTLMGAEKDLTQTQCGQLLLAKMTCKKLRNIVAVRGGEHYHTVLPSNLHTYEKFLQDHRRWTSKHAKTVFTENANLKPVYRVQENGLCTWTSSASVKDYDYRMQFQGYWEADASVYTNISRFIRNELDDVPLCELIFQEHFPTNVNLPRNRQNLECLFNKKRVLSEWVYEPFMTGNSEALLAKTKHFIAECQAWSATSL